MGRKKEKIDLISLDVRIRLYDYCRGNLTWLFHNHDQFRGMSVQSFYAIMRREPGTAYNIRRFELLDAELLAKGTYPIQTVGSSAPFPSVNG